MKENFFSLFTEVVDVDGDDDDDDDDDDDEINEPESMCVKQPYFENLEEQVTIIETQL